MASVGAAGDDWQPEGDVSMPARPPDHHIRKEQRFTAAVNTWNGSPPRASHTASYSPRVIGTFHGASAGKPLQRLHCSWPKT